VKLVEGFGSPSREREVLGKELFWKGGGGKGSEMEKSLGKELYFMILGGHPQKRSIQWTKGRTHKN